MDGTGPTGQGSEKGRKLGNCSTLSDEAIAKKLGVGMGKGRKSSKSSGQGKRFKSGLNN